MARQENNQSQENELRDQIYERTGATESASLKDRLLHRNPPVGSGQVVFEQDKIPRGFLPEKPLHKLITRGLIAFADPSIIEVRKDRDIIQETKDHLADGGGIVTVINHLSHTDGPQIKKTLDAVGIKDAYSLLGIRIIRNKVAKHLMQGVPIITVYPESEQFWKSEEFKAIESTLSQKEIAYVKRERELAFEMQKKALSELNTAFEEKHPVILFPEGTRRPGLGLGEPVAGSAGIMNRGEKTKVLVMTIMGTENLMPKGKGRPRFSKVQTRFVDLIDPKEITQKFALTNPSEGKIEANKHLLDEVMKTMAEGLAPEYRGRYADVVDTEHEFREISSEDSIYKRILNGLDQ